MRFFINNRDVVRWGTINEWVSWIEYTILVLANSYISLYISELQYHATLFIDCVSFLSKKHLPITLQRYVF